MIFGGPTANESKRSQKLIAREVNKATSLSEAVPTYLKWSKTVITFDRTNHPNHIP